MLNQYHAEPASVQDEQVTRLQQGHGMAEHAQGSAATGRITIDLAAIRRNWTNLSRKVAPADCASVVKADAYGLGAEQIVPVLSDAGCSSFFVATLQEAKDIKPLVPDARIFILDGLLPGWAGPCADLDVLPVLSTRQDIANWTAQAARRSVQLKAALHLDSGLNRLGLSQHDLDQLRESKSAFAGLDVQLVMSHLACADDPAAPENKTQRLQFDRMRAQFPDTPASLAASDGLMLGPDYHYDLVRPGYALYGGQAFQGGQTPVDPVVSVSAKVLQVRRLNAGDKIGYSATFTAPSDMSVAIVGAGYADGVPSTASSGGTQGGQVAINGTLAPIVGRVSMDLIAVDVTSIPVDVLRHGMDVELVGPTLPLDRVGQQAGTIGYEILTRLSPRFERVYVDGDTG